MALLNPDLNVDLANKSFSEKRKVYKNSSLLLTSSMAEENMWETDQINARQFAMADLAVQVWKI